MREGIILKGRMKASILNTAYHQSSGIGHSRREEKRKEKSRVH